VAGLGLLEQVPLTDADVDPSFPARLEATVAGTRRFVAQLEPSGRRAPARLRLPAVELPGRSGAAFIDPLPAAGRPFVVSTRASFSAGGVRGRRGGTGREEAATLDDAGFAQALAANGFTALITQPVACPEADLRARLEAVVAKLPNARRLELEGGGWLGWAWDAAGR